MTALSEEGWAQLLLTDMGAPTTANNVGNIERWMTAEEPTSDWFDRDNPLNSSYLTGGPGDGTGDYVSLDAAASADAAQITEAGTTPTGVDTDDKYTAIYNALVGDDSTVVFAAAVEASPWASSHYADDPIANIPVPAGGPSGSTGDSTGATGTGTGTTTGTTGTTGATLTGISLNPVTDAEKGAEAGIEAVLDPFVSSIPAIAAKLLFIGCALGLIIVGTVKTASPGTSVSDKVKSALPGQGGASIDDAALLA